VETNIALAGNPNAGKTTLFNALTGARQHVGNYPGVTVEKKEGLYVNNGHCFNIVDLPGTYSLTAYSQEEVVARDFLVNEKPRLVVNIIDAANLERNLYLTIQLREMGIPVCLALNMIDVAANRGITIDHAKLSQLMGIAVVPTVARQGTGKRELMNAAARMIAEQPANKPMIISYGKDIDLVLDRMERRIRESGFLDRIGHARWIALKYLEKDSQVMARGRTENQAFSTELETLTQDVEDHLHSTLDTYPEAVIADHRYGYIHSLIRQGVVQRKIDQDRLFMSDKIDRVVMNRFLGPILMLAVVFALYHFTFTYSEVPVGWVEALFGWLSAAANNLLPDGLLKSLVVSGIIDGVGGVMGFVPLIMFMFLGVSLLEDSGYLARVAFMLDRIFRIFGLHGSSVMAFIVSGGIAGGCAVPGVMATRTLKSPRERLATLLTVPFMNCGAKLPVFALLVAAFFANKEALVMLVITLVSWIGALLIARLLRSTVIRGAATPFVMELPPYRLPTFKGLLIHTWERTWQYIKKAGTVILGISIILWAMMTFPGLPQAERAQFAAQRQTVLDVADPQVVREFEAMAINSEASAAARELADRIGAIENREAKTALRRSLAGRIGSSLEPITSWAGFDWRTNIALIGGFAAKEVVVSTLGTAYSLGEVDAGKSQSLADRLAAAPGWSAVTAMSLMIFIIFYAPCFVTVTCIVRESGSWKWGAFSMAFNTLTAFILATLVYQVGSLLA